MSTSAGPQARTASRTAVMSELTCASGSIRLGDACSGLARQSTHTVGELASVQSSALLLTMNVCEEGVWKSRQTWLSASASEWDPSSLTASSLEPTARAWAGVRLRASTRAALRSPNAVSNTCSASCKQDERDGLVFFPSAAVRIASERCCAKCTTASASSMPDSVGPASARKPLARWIAIRLDIVVGPQGAAEETVGSKGERRPTGGWRLQR